MKKTRPPKNLKTFQDWCIDTLYMILKMKKKYRGNLFDQGYIFTLKSIVDHFSSMYYCGPGKTPCRNKEKEHINLWWDHLNQGNRKQFFAPIPMSKKAAQFIQSHKNIRAFGGQSGKLHLEHITPDSYVYQKLRKLKKPTRKGIAACFKHCKLVLLTKEESDKYLDGKDAKFSKKDVTMLRRVFQMDEASLEEAKNLINERAKANGSGLLRIVRLYNSGVRFCNSKGKQMGLKKCLAYLDEDNYEFFC